MSTKFSVNESFVPLFELNADFGLNIQETFAFERPRKSLSLCLLRRQRRKRQQMHEAWNPFAACSHSAPLPSTLLMTDIRQFLPKNNQSISFQWLCSADDNTRGTWSPPSGQGKGIACRNKQTRLYYGIVTIVKHILRSSSHCLPICLSLSAEEAYAQNRIHSRRIVRACMNIDLDLLYTQSRT